MVDWDFVFLVRFVKLEKVFCDFLRRLVDRVILGFGLGGGVVSYGNVGRECVLLVVGNFGRWLGGLRVDWVVERRWVVLSMVWIGIIYIFCMGYWGRDM